MTAVLLYPAAMVLVSLATAEPPAKQEVRAQRIEASVLAPCCYTEPVSRHQSEIAVKMRIEIAKWIAAGRTDQEILDTYVQRYGAKVLVDPRTLPRSWTPWIPWLAVIFAMMFGFWLVGHWRARMPAVARLSGPDAGTLPDIDEEE